MLDEDDLHTLASRAEDPDPAVRERALEELLALARDKGEFRRLRPLEVFGRLGPSDDPRVLQALLDGLADPSEWVQQPACLALARWGAAAAPAVGRLIPLLRTAVDEYACTALGAIGPAAALAVPMLRERVRRGDPSGKDHARQALAKITAGAPAPQAPMNTPPAAAALGGERSIDTGVPDAELLAIAPDDASFAVAVEDVVIRRSLADGAELGRVSHGAPVAHVVLSADGELVVTTGHDRRLLVSRAAGGEPVHASSDVAIHTGAAPRFSPGGRRLAFIVQDGIRVWDRDRGGERTLPFHHLADTLLFEDDDTLFVWSSTGARRFDLAAGQATAEHPARGSRSEAVLLRGPGGRLLLASHGAKKGDVSVEDAVTGEHLLTLSGPFERGKAIVATPDGAALVVLSGKVVHAYRLPDGALVAAVKPKRFSIRHGALGGKVAGAIDFGGRLMTWSVG